MSLGLVDARRTLFAWLHCANFDGGRKDSMSSKKILNASAYQHFFFFLQFSAFNLVQTIWRSPFSIPKGPVQIERYMQTWLGKFGVEEVFVSQVSSSNICAWSHKCLEITTDTPGKLLLLQMGEPTPYAYVYRRGYTKSCRCNGQMSQYLCSCSVC